MDFLAEARDKSSFYALPLRCMRAVAWFAAWARKWIRARLWHAMTLAFILGLGVGAML